MSGAPTLGRAQLDELYRAGIRNAYIAQQYLQYPAHDATDDHLQHLARRVLNNAANRRALREYTAAQEAMADAPPFGRV